ncbi:unnamed protein product [Clonostachys solani]|uniref:Uncharacterized protein n=1 Tax=Clonostachys solani TaxID=160281 RepID=A0A9N9YTR4_9HYPO|nr:unnamed protein product [Clonostachys solani]
MFSNDEQAPPRYDFTDKTITPPGRPLAESHQHQLISKNFISKISSPYDGDLVSALVDQDAENPSFIIIDGNTGELVHRFRLHKDCGDFSYLSHMKSMLGTF